jgi:hypothetical protein
MWAASVTDGAGLGSPLASVVVSRRRVMKVVHCPCGTDVQGESDDQLVENVEAHFASDHPDMVGSYSREQILGMAHDQ